VKQLAAALALLSLAAAPAHAADAAHPTVVELFQSQGCSSCPPANRQLLAIAGRPEILALTWEVTYWNSLGWKDSFGDHAFTARQYEYARGLGHDGVFTPQVIVNGRADGVGDSAAELAALLRRADRGDAGPAIGLAGDSVSIGAAQGEGEVVLVRYDPRLVRVAIRAGENAGEMLPHRNVVMQLARLAAWNGRAETLALPPPARPGLRTAILVQASPGGPILAAATD
jgi:hypothetical protein